MDPKSSFDIEDLRAQSQLSSSFENTLPTQNKEEQKNIRIAKLFGVTFGEKIAWFFIVVALIVNIVSIFLHFTTDFLIASPQSKLAATLWFISVILAGLSALFFASKIKNKKRIKRYFKKWRHISFSSVLASISSFFSTFSFGMLPHILLFAFLIRVIPIQQNGLFLDEWYWLDSARRIHAGLVPSPFGFIGDQPSNMPAFPVAFLLAIMKNPVLSVRLTGVIYSIFAIIFVYLLARKLMGKNAAIVSALLLAVSVWDIHMSNLGWNNVNLNPMLIAGVLYYLYRIFTNDYDTKVLFFFALFVSICIHLLYVTALVIIPAIYCLIVLTINWIRTKSGPTLRNMIIFLLYFVICVSPIVPKLSMYPQQSIGRHSEFIEVNVIQSESKQSAASYYFDQSRYLLDDFNTGKNNFQAEGLWGITISKMSLALFYLGLVLVMIQVLRKKASSYWIIIIITLATLLLIPFVLLYRTTSVWRAYAILPIIFLLITFSLVQIAKMLKFITKKYLFHKKGLLKIYLIISVILFFLMSINWFGLYFDHYLDKPKNYETKICQYASDLIDTTIPIGATIYLPDEMCAPLITIMYRDNQYRFMPVTTDNNLTEPATGSFFIILNSQNFGGYHVQEIQENAERIIADTDAELISQYSATQPVVYLIR